jgi:hypothetical protein
MTATSMLDPNSLHQSTYVQRNMNYRMAQAGGEGAVYSPVTSLAENVRHRRNEINQGSALANDHITTMEM